MSEANYESPLGLDVETLESSFNLLAPQAETLVARFYEELFKRYPGWLRCLPILLPRNSKGNCLPHLSW